MQLIRGSTIDFEAAGHEDPQRPGVVRRVLATRNELLDGRVQMINWARLPAGSEFRYHYHEDMQEAFIIITGHAQLTVDGVLSELRPGDLVLIDPREVHQMRNVSTEEDVEYLVVGITQDLGGRTIVI